MISDTVGKREVDLARKNIRKGHPPEVAHHLRQVLLVLHLRVLTSNLIGDSRNKCKRTRNS